MAIKRNAFQTSHVLQTSEHLVYKLPNRKSGSSDTTMSVKPGILGVPTAWLYRDLLRTFVTTLLVLALLLGLKASQLLS